jgi:hypothetical protein
MLEVTLNIVRLMLSRPSAYTLKQCNYIVELMYVDEGENIAD